MDRQRGPSDCQHDPSVGYHFAKLEWVTPEAETTALKVARISSANPNSEDTRLIGYLIRNGHVSPFETVNAAIYVHTTRTIGRQLLRHRSFSFQELSQRYKNLDPAPEDFYVADMRMQDEKNRQKSLEIDAKNPAQTELSRFWKENASKRVREAIYCYNETVSAGGAKEVARDILPEGCTPTTIFMNGTLRSWIFFLRSRCPSLGAKGVQKEMGQLAESIASVLEPHFPVTFDYLRIEANKARLFERFMSQVSQKIRIQSHGITVDGVVASIDDICFDITTPGEQ